MKITKEEMALVIATGKMHDLGLYPEEIAEILKQPYGTVRQWIWFHEMNKALQHVERSLSY